MEDYRGAEQGRPRRARPTAFLLRGVIVRVGHSAARTTSAGGAGSVTPSCTSRCVGLTVARIDFARATSPAVPCDEDQKGIGLQSALVFENAVLGNAHAVDRGADGAGAPKATAPSTAERAIAATAPSAMTGPVMGEERKMPAPNSPHKPPQKPPYFPQNRMRPSAL